MPKHNAPGLAIVAASAPMFMVALNNLLVTNALPAISSDFSASEVDLQWIIDGYILAFAGFLVTAAALGDSYGRRRVFLGGIALFTLSSIGCALCDSVGALIAGRVLQGIGAAAVMPLSLTLLAAAVSERKRSAAIGIWGGVNGLGIALGPMVGGAVTEGIDWKWIFWINVPVGVATAPLILSAVRESKGIARRLDLAGMILITGAVTFAVWGIVLTSNDGWGSALVLGIFAVAALLLSAFVWWEGRTADPLLPLRFYRIPAFVLSNIVSFAMFFGVFGSIFFIAQYLQGPLGFSPLEAGVRTLPWTAMPMIIAPFAGLITDRVGGGRLMALGLAMQGGALAWISQIATIDTSYPRLIAPLAVAGVGMGFALAPTASVVLSSVREHEHGKASGANTMIREVGGALGVAVLTTVYRGHIVPAHILSPVDADEAFVAGMVSAIRLGVVVTLLGALTALCIPRKVRPGGSTRTTADDAPAETVNPSTVVDQHT